MDRRQYIRDALGNLRFRLLRRLGTRPGRSGMARSVALVLVAIVVIGGIALAASELSDNGSSSPAPRPIAQATGGSGEPVSRESFLARLIPVPPETVKGPKAPRSVSDLVHRLPLQRKVAQLFLWGFEGQDLTAPIFGQLRKYDLGGIVIQSPNYQNPQQLSSMAGEAVVISQQAKHVPPWVMAAQEGGDFSEFADLPPAHALGDLHNAREGAKEAGAAGRALKSLGVTGVLAPDVDVGSPGGAVFGKRLFSDQADKVAGLGAAVVRAYGGAGVLSAPKYFPGTGAVSQPPDQGPAQVGLSMADLRARDLRPFRAAIRAGAPAVVIGSGLYASDDFVTPALLSSNITTGLLRRELHYRGVAITDDLASPSVTAFESIPDAAVGAIRAGADLVYISGTQGKQEAAYLAVLNAVRKGDISRARVNEALARALIAKQKLGLIQRGGKPGP
jgi:beta-N-acetylhexosaminidase